jgi:hypothetical protein
MNTPPRSKIGQLPENLKLKIRKRLRAREPMHSILAWLNELPVVVKTCSNLLSKKLISDGNLSEYKNTQEYLEWSKKMDELAQKKYRAQLCGELESASLSVASQSVSDTLLAWAQGVTADDIKCATAEKPDLFCKFLTLLNSFCTRKDEVHARKKALSLQIEKFEFSAAAAVLKNWHDPATKALMSKNISNDEKIAALRDMMFGP